MVVKFRKVSHLPAMRFSVSFSVMRGEGTGVRGCSSASFGPLIRPVGPCRPPSPRWPVDPLNTVDCGEKDAIDGSMSIPTTASDQTCHADSPSRSAGAILLS